MGWVISLENVSVRDRNNPIIEDITLKIKRKEWVGIIGPNGAGKTTLLKVIAGRVKLHEGSVKVKGSIGYVPQLKKIDEFIPLRVYDVVMMGRYRKIGLLKRPGKDDKDKVIDVLRKMEMEDYAMKPLGLLSGGERQKVFIARALVSEPDILLLDEPTTGLDVNAQREITALIKKIHEEGVTVVMVTHDLNPVSPYLTRVVYMKKKIFACGEPSKVLSSDVLSKLYNAPVDVFERNGHICVIVEDAHYE